MSGLKPRERTILEVLTCGKSDFKTPLWKSQMCNLQIWFQRMDVQPAKLNRLGVSLGYAFQWLETCKGWARGGDVGISAGGGGIFFFFSESTLISVAVSPQLPCFPGAQSDSSEAEVLLEMEAGFLHGFSVGGYLEKTPANRVSVGDVVYVERHQTSRIHRHHQAATTYVTMYFSMFINIA